MTRTNEEKLEQFANLIEPVGELLGDGEVAAKMRSGKKTAAISLAIKNHKQAVVSMLAALDGVAVADYHVPNPLALAAKLLKLLNDPDLQELFTSQPQKIDAASSGAAMESTEGGAN